LSTPGLDLASAISSFTDFAGTLGFSTSTLGLSPTRAIMLKLFSGW
jgi:hypothetical protein